ncbi:MAG: LysM peptidoglycan-binding domain-containing protein [Myxococcales bacterium]|nr:LysM peptidoglycan-binding domain-containing protein [Myxococcales bacterium]MCB9702782.1 LysM peptidoglycan-binding domain-containing protein [Myxococcales bacterium]
MVMKDYGRSVLGGLLSSVGLPSLGSSSGPTKLEIKHETSTAGSYSGSIKALFNPSTLNIQSAVAWKKIARPASITEAAYALQFNNGGVTPATLSFDLLFDTYEGDPGSGGGWGSLISLPNPTALHTTSAPSGVSVLTYTNKVVELTQINRELHRPPNCEVWWGMVLLCVGPLSSLSQSFTRFLADGTPVRAKLSCTFTASADEEAELRSSDVEKTHTVRLGDTLHAIAGLHYGDPGKWRVIARANQIDDPRALRPGTVLAIPAIR